MANDAAIDFENVALPHMNSVLRAALAMCGRMDLAEDLTQTTFVKAFENFASFRPGTNCKAWLLGILRNSWIDQLRGQKSAPRAMNIDELQVPAAPDSPTRKARSQLDLEVFGDRQVIKALSLLPPEQRLTLYLICVEEMSCQEVAEITDVPVGTVKSRASIGRAALRERLASYATDMGFIGRRQHASDK